tara:strand:+ start:1349 stop:1975 length:627 start_codon:yes stop_codon:yes gene_type:complete
MSFYMVIEGTDGCGKDTQADLLISRMVESGLDPLRVAEPCEDLPHGRLLRELLSSGEHPESHAALFLSDRMALQAGTVRPALEAERPVVSVRSFLSTLVYQQENWPLDWLIEIHKMMVAKPDVVVWLDVDPDIGLERVGKRAIAKEYYEKAEIQERNRGRYRTLVTDSPAFLGLIADDPLIIVVDASQTRDEIHAEIWQQVAPRMEAG